MEYTDFLKKQILSATEQNNFSEVKALAHKLERLAEIYSKDTRLLPEDLRQSIEQTLVSRGIPDLHRGHYLNRGRVLFSQGHPPIRIMAAIEAEIRKPVQKIIARPPFSGWEKQKGGRT